MINPNKGASKEVLRRLKEGSYERMRLELKCSIELLLKEYNLTWDNIGRLLKIDNPKKDIVQNEMTLSQLNEIAHIFSTELYIIFRPRSPWTQT